jgi:hypothetical protein
MSGKRAFTVYPRSKAGCPSFASLRRVLSVEGPPSPLSSRPERSWASGPTQGDEKQLLFSNYFPWKAPSLPLSSRLPRRAVGPERTRISCFALLATSTCAALRGESRMQILNATGLHRKSGGAQWRDLRFSGPFVGMFFDRAYFAAWSWMWSEPGIPPLSSLITP